MCGIVGCVTEGDDAPKLLVDGLRRLEYRGYDSAGIAVIQDGVIETLREAGKLANLESTLKGSTIRGGTGLGHTRWATHGRPTQINAHPHRDASGKVVVVHNGIIENFRELRAQLESEGTTFVSDTDSEVIAHLVARNYEGDLAQAVCRSAAVLRGAWAIGVMHADQPDRLVAARKDCPLVIGLGEDANYLASDVTAIMDLTRRVVFLREGEIAAIDRNSLEVFHADGQKVDWVATEIGWSLA
ncbi:MAG: class II glutamine amidotransferase, partial [Planctomycetes bacterium]|nr:class II glutamine amidotransferase [Planctomycetota bacterium]